VNSRISGINSNSSVKSDLHYGLPLDIEQISNFHDIINTFRLTEAAKNILIGNGFVVISHPTVQYRSTYVYPTRITEVYKKLREYDVPLFVTCDSLLDAFHTAVDNIMKIMEEKTLFEKVLKLTKTFLSESTTIYNNLNDDDENDLKVAARLNVAYFSVALKLLVHEENVPAQVADLVTSELANIISSSQISRSVIFGYDVDYTQFTTRGHYSDTVKLEKYFKALMWYGMINFELSNSMQLIQACMIAYILSKNKILRTEFDGIKTVTEFLAGTADDVGPYELLNVVNGIVIDNFNLQLLTDEVFLKQLKTALDKLPPPRIMDVVSAQRMLIPSFSQEIANKKLEESRGMRLIGQRFTIDSYIFTNLVLLEYTGDTAPFTAVSAIRAFPRLF
jgi:chlorite dismutase